MALTYLNPPDDSRIFLATWRATGNQTLSIGIENVLDKRYVSYFSQTLTGSSADNFNNFAGREVPMNSRVVKVAA